MAIAALFFTLAVAFLHLVFMVMETLGMPLGSPQRMSLLALCGGSDEWPNVKKAIREHFPFNPPAPRGYAVLAATAIPWQLTS